MMNNNAVQELYGHNVEANKLITKSCMGPYKNVTLVKNCELK